VKNCIVQIDCTPFRSWYAKHYGIDPVKSKTGASKAVAGEEVKKQSRTLKKKIESRNKDRIIDPKVEEQFSGQRLLACISSRPGQSGRADGYILEGKELEFYVRKMDQKRR
jgi:small subunit ribosomal protein S8e